MSGADPTYPPLSPLATALQCRCPRCGKGKLYGGLLSVAPVCAQCGLDLKAQDAGDGPAVFVVLILGALVVALALLVEVMFAPPMWVHIVLWTPTIFGGAILMLRPLKAWLIAMQYRHHLLGGAGAPGA
jgi:uncharacterized protein (DUF983 family)